MFQISIAIGHWLASMIALTLAVLHPAPRHTEQRHHQPVTLPELASAADLHPLG